MLFFHVCFESILQKAKLYLLLGVELIVFEPYASDKRTHPKFIVYQKSTTLKTLEQR